MKLGSSVFFALFVIPLISHGLAEAKTGLGNARGRPSQSASDQDNGDEGLRFVCQRRELPLVKAEMVAYLRALGIAPGLVVVSERAAKGILVYTLATPPGDVSTLDFASRAELGIGREQVELGRQPMSATIDTVSQKEIVLALLQHGRLTDLRGSDCSVDLLVQHVALRQNIVAWAERLRWGWPNGGPAAWNPAYWVRGTPRAGVTIRQAIDDTFENQRAYAIGCYTATKLVMVKGILDFYDRVRAMPAMSGWLHARLLSDREPLYSIEPAAAWSFEPDFDPKEASRPGKLLSITRDVAAKNFVPGDWAYMRNTDPVSSQKVGYEGSNAIYLGGGRFDDYYGENNHSFTYEEKLDEVYQWRNGVFDRTRDAAKRIPLKAEDLELLGGPPSQGGLVKSWRLIPSFFGAAAKRKVVSSSMEPMRLETRGSASRLIVRREGRGRATPATVAVP